MNQSKVAKIMTIRENMRKDYVRTMTKELDEMTSMIDEYVADELRYDDIYDLLTNSFSDTDLLNYVCKDYLGYIPELGVVCGKCGENTKNYNKAKIFISHKCDGCRGVNKVKTVKKVEPFLKCECGSEVKHPNNVPAHKKTNKHMIYVVDKKSGKNLAKVYKIVEELDSDEE